MKLIFVYNANSSIFSQITDYVHKTISPSTYQCKLCGLTFGAMGEKKEWSEFVKSLGVKSIFLHKDEFRNKYPSHFKDPLPAVYYEDRHGTHRLISRGEIEEEHDVAGLKELVGVKIRGL